MFVSQMRHSTVPLVMCVLPMGAPPMREGWSFVYTVAGGPFVTTAGTAEMVKLCAGSWAIGLKMVSVELGVNGLVVF